MSTSKLILDRDAFMRRLQRQRKDKEWDYDVKSYELWKRLADKYGHEAAIQRVKELEAKWPSKLGK